MNSGSALCKPFAHTRSQLVTECLTSLAVPTQTLLIAFVFSPLYNAYMVRRLLQWMRDNKLSAALIVVLLLVLLGQRGVNTFSMVSPMGGYNTQKSVGVQQEAMRLDYATQPSFDSIAPPASGNTPAKERLVSRNAYLSMVVKDVRKTLAAINKLTEEAGGYVVTSSISNPEGNGYAIISMRVLSASLNESLQAIKEMGIKTVSENIEGTDITNEFKDVQEHLRLVLETKAKFETMLKASTQVEDSLSILREMQNLQYQVDQLRGEERYLSESAKYSHITVNISMDEYELPYAPQEPWSASAIFKNAVRELIRTLRGYAEKLIWLVVFSVIWIPAVAVGYILYKRVLRKLL